MEQYASRLVLDTPPAWRATQGIAEGLLGSVILVRFASCSRNNLIQQKG
jgi:hypothetical protein